MKKITKLSLTALAIIALAVSVNAATYFSDNYTITNGSGDANYELNNGIMKRIMVDSFRCNNLMS